MQSVGRVHGSEHPRHEGERFDVGPDVGHIVSESSASTGQHRHTEVDDDRRRRSSDSTQGLFQHQARTDGDIQVRQPQLIRALEGYESLGVVGFGSTVR